MRDVIIYIPLVVLVAFVSGYLVGVNRQKASELKAYVQSAQEAVKVRDKADAKVNKTTDIDAALKRIGGLRDDN